ncbi:MAG TPA: rhomboid family intramembrane serine protease [Haliscomenobacter sp.]|uniref:rhomboid family intramembrane serine protease n=1 Tax=Haliscomenobacter sp. TaxID=2717303 RepID=UPI002BD9D53A|nr:rhomboid family intramembrane serine protease [Haliscomenobacter sp.]HOY18969.1 rhomboid family intramembrane serine protease [Haliscomenobacter sp.]HPH18856.1 rhomboid family intramembrane serine protease [Haliscomenobacter sp.]
MTRITDVVKHLLIINVLVFFATLLAWGNPAPELMGSLLGGTGDFANWERYQLALFFPSSPYFRPYQLVSHMFMHADIRHLLLNMLGLYMFGSALETFWGERKFLFYYLFSGLGGMLLYLFVKYLEISSGNVEEQVMKYYLQNVPMLGASGAIFGLMVGYGVQFPDNVISLLFPPISLKAKYFVLIFAGLELFFGLGIVNISSGVAHFAHLGGALFGFLLILYWRKYGSRL